MGKGKGLLGVQDVAYNEVPLSDDLAWLKHRIGKLVAGGIYLLSGEPGIGKSTLAIQIALDLGRRGIPSLYILTEQSSADLLNRARLMGREWPSSDVKRAFENVNPEEWTYDMKELPNYLSRQVLAKGGRYHGVKLIVIDSLQGRGVSPLASKQYRHIYDFCDNCKANNLTPVLVTHVTKSGAIAGPKTLEHKVDCVMYMKKAFVYRPLFVPKNRYGPAVFRPIALEMDPNTTMLRISRFAEVQGGVARTFIGRDFLRAEAQAVVTLPTYGTRGRITAPNLPRDEIQRLLHAINGIPDMDDVADLSYSIQCNLPGGKFYKRVIDLALAMALLSSYLQREIPSTFLYIGELDLLRSVRPVGDDLVQDLWETIKDGKLGKELKVFCAGETARILRPEIGKTCSLVGCDTLEEVLYKTWTDLKRENIPSNSEDKTK